MRYRRTPVLTRYFTGLLCFLASCICAQSGLPPAELINAYTGGDLNPEWVNYTVSESVADSVQKYTLIHNERNSYQWLSLKESKASRKRSKGAYLSYVSRNKNDSINIVILPKDPVNIGFRVVIVKKKALVFFFAYESEPASGIFKYSKSDPAYLTGILVPARQCRLVLTQQPEFKEGEIISGYLEFESFPYRIRYDKYYDEAEQSYAEGYFNTSDFLNSKKD